MKEIEIINSEKTSSLKKRITKIVNYLLLITLTSIIISSCSSPSESAYISEPGRRDYVWTVDTIKQPFFDAFQIWGSSPDDVWVVGPGGSLGHTIWHYNGKKWSTDGMSRGISPRCIYGFSRDNAWIAGSEGQIWHFNGYDWKRNYVFQKLGSSAYFVNIWGDNSSNIYVVGQTGIGETTKSLIVKYNGEYWSEIRFSINNYAFTDIKKSSESGNTYFQAIALDSLSNSIHCIYEFDNKQFKKLYTGTNENGSFIQEIDQQLYFVIGKVINKYNGKFHPCITINENKFVFRIYGKTLKDLFLNMSDGLAHYNGENTEYLLKFKNRQMFMDMMIFEKTVFVLTIDFENSINLIYKGVLQEK